MRPLPKAVCAAAVLAALLLGEAAAAREGGFRIVLNPSLCGVWSPDTASGDMPRRRRHLAYLARLGYTHILYSMADIHGHGDPATFFSRVPGRGWTYNGGDYASGPLARAFSSAKEAVEANGMRLLPLVESLSHIHYYIAFDSTISEHADWKSWCAERSLDCAYWNNHVAALSDTGAGSGNPGADQFFRENLRIIKANWGRTALGGAAPDAIHIGHDELGGYARRPDGSMIGPVSYLKASRSRNAQATPSALVAREMAARIAEVDSVFGQGTQVIAYGDSFLPNDNGAAFGLAGRAGDGRDGVLWLLAEKWKASGRLIVMPWAYSALDGEDFLGAPVMVDGAAVKVDRRAQVAYLERLGYRYIPGTGEDGGGAGYHPRPAETKKAIYQWHQAALERPKGLAGFAHLTYDDFDRCDSASGVCVEYSAPLLAYLAWTFPAADNPFRGRAYTGRTFEGVDAGRSRRERDWKRGVHFKDPDFPEWWQFWRR